MATFFAVFNQTELPHRTLSETGKKHGNVEFAEAAQEAMFVKVTGATTVAEVQAAIFDRYGGNVTQTPIVVTEAQWKSS